MERKNQPFGKSLLLGMLGLFALTSLGPPLALGAESSNKAPQAGQQTPASQTPSLETPAKKSDMKASNEAPKSKTTKMAKSKRKKASK